MRGSRVLAFTSLVAVVASACVSTPQYPDDPEESGGRCQMAASKNWEAAVGTNDTLMVLPEKLRTCTLPLSKDSVPYLINSAARFKFWTDANANHGAEGQWYSFTTMNTLDSAGSPRGNWVQVADEWAPVAGGGLKYQATSGRYYEEFEIPLSVWVGWLTVPDSLERDSLNVRYYSRVTRSDPDFPDDSGVYIASTYVRVNDATPGSIVGLSGASVGVQQGWEFGPAVDSMGYRFDWYWNGVPQPTWKDFYMLWFTPTTAGQHTIRLDQKLIDTTYSITKVITVPIVTSIGGPTAVNPWVTNTYVASASYGTAPYSYYWTVDGSYFSSNASIVTPAWNQLSEHDITLTVSDANNAAGYAEVHVFTTGGECDINDPGCNVELRAAPTSAKKPAAVKRMPANARQWQQIRRP